VGSWSVRIRRSFGFIDLSGFTAMTAADGDERAVAVLSSFRSLVREICSRRGVRIDKWLGDGAMLVCVEPGPLIATLLELEYQADRVVSPLRVRSGATCGEVLLHEGDDYIGDRVNVAARLCDLAPGGQFYATLDMAASRPPWSKIVEVLEQEVKGFAEPLEVVSLGLADLGDDSTRCPVCGIPLTSTVAASSARDASGALVLFCADSCRETWERRPRPSSAEQGSLRSPLMGS